MRTGYASTIISRPHDLHTKAESMATITFFGAAQEVTGSCHFLNSTACGKVLLDCGMHQGGDAVKRIKKDNFDFDPESIDAVILSHAHLDHSGLLPKLVHQGFSGPIYCTAATADLLRIMLDDSAGLYTRDLERNNLRRRRSGRRPLTAEYSRADVDKVLELCKKQLYREPVKISIDATVTFHDAGHILGSAIVEITLKEDDKIKKLVFSGDLGKKDSILMNDPATLDSADVVLMESTYGNRNHRDLNTTIEELSNIIEATWDRGGNVLIPSFAVGRTQEILFHLGCLHHDGLLDNWQVFLDSPMAIKVTQVYDRWLNILDDEDIKELTDAHKESLQAFLPSLKLCVTSEQSIDINKIKRGAIIIAGSGMCTGGRIRHHLKHRIWRDNNTLLFIGFQARGTLGRLLVDGVKRVKIFGEKYVVKSHVETLGGFSAHAGQSGLIDWISQFKTNPQIALVHGEPEAIQILSDKLKQEQNIDTLMPAHGDQLFF